MASRKIKDDEKNKLKSLGDMTSTASENVLALDGIAIIVNRENPISTLSKEQLAQIFSGEITDWSQVLSPRGKIKVYARDDKSGTFSTFKDLVLGSKPLLASAARFEDSNKLSDSVAADPNGIGFAGLTFIRNAKAIAIGESGADPLMPTRFTVATEDYPLTRRLYLYTPATPQNPLTRKFVEFAFSKDGQDSIEKSGFVSLTPEMEAPKTTTPGAQDEYQRVTENAKRLSLNFRFRSNSKQLDNKALEDIDHVVALLGDLK
jgi:phosphate transport system substrate-binding protein